jgi:alpha-D-ribose 1-methylphosphonate 5-triphosphate synthase subunit PhnG
VNVQTSTFKRGLEYQAHALSTLSGVPAQTLKRFADELLGDLEVLNVCVEVLENRTGLVMLPAQDNAHGTRFFLGEVLVSEARVRVDGVEGYGVCLGRDLEQSLAVGILDTFLRVLDDEASPAERAIEERIHTFISAQANAQLEQDVALMRKVESTRVEMETF